MSKIKITAADIAAMNDILENIKRANEAILSSVETGVNLVDLKQARANLELGLDPAMTSIIEKFNRIVEQPVSERIRERLEANGVRYYAGDNISEHLQSGEREELIEELTEKFTDVLNSLVIDTKNDPNSIGTGRRLAKMYINEIMSGRYDDKPDVTAFPNEGSKTYKGMIVIRAELHSMCSHHHQPVDLIGFIGIIPNGQVLGLSKYIRLAQWAARRGTLQEELTEEILEIIKRETGSNDCAVYLEGFHGCCENRGVMAHSSLTQTTSLSGSFEELKVKEEFYSNIKLQKMNKRD